MQGPEIHVFGKLVPEQPLSYIEDRDPNNMYG